MERDNRFWAVSLFKVSFQCVFTERFVLMKLKLNKYSLLWKPLWNTTSVQQSAFRSQLIIGVLGLFSASCGEVGQGSGPGMGADCKSTLSNIFWIALLSESASRGGHFVFRNPRTLIKNDSATDIVGPYAVPSWPPGPLFPNGTGSKGPCHKSTRGRGKVGRFGLRLKNKFILTLTKYVNTFLRLSPNSSRVPPRAGSRHTETDIVTSHATLTGCEASP